MATKKKTASDYAIFSEETQTMMAAIEKHLTAKFGSIDPAWRTGLQLMATNMEVCLSCKRQIAADGVVIKTDGKYKTNPLCKQLNETQVQLIKLLQEYGLSPKAQKHTKKEEVKDDNTAEFFLEALTSK